MEYALKPFAALRLPYQGVQDTIKCIEIDLQMNRLYAASNTGGVFVWNLKTHQPFALMKHEQWVNAVRCYPPKEDPTQSGADSPGEDITPFVLTACENGVLSAWCPVTFLIKSRVRPGTGPLMDMLLTRVEKHTKKFITRSEYLCYVISLRHVYVIKVTPSFQVLHDLVHAGSVLCFAPHHSARTQSLLCGQDNGCISMWSLSTGKYECTIEYPPDDPDIMKDSQQPSIHKPQMGEKYMVSHTFRYNKERSRKMREGDHFRIEDSPEEAAKYASTIAIELDPFYVNNPAKSARKVKDVGVWKGLLPQHLPLEDTNPDLYRVPDKVTFDLRRVNCIVSSPRDSRKSHRFYTGHGTGEVLIWEASFNHQPIMLLKKVQVFGFRTWVWHMQAMEVPHMEDPTEAFSVNPQRPVTLQFCVWGDNGDVRYMQAMSKVVVANGPGFLATSSYFWRGPEMDLHQGQNISSNTSKNSAEGSVSGGVKGNESRGVGYYMLMGSVEGRLEIFDVGCVVDQLRNASW